MLAYILVNVLALGIAFIANLLAMLVVALNTLTQHEKFSCVKLGTVGFSNPQLLS